MDLTKYDIIKGPVISDKAYKLNKAFNKLFIKVHPHANKRQVKQALHDLFQVEVDKVNMITRKGKRRMVKRREVFSSDTKLAIVTLAEGYALDLFDQTGSGIPVKNDTESKS